MEINQLAYRLISGSITKKKRLKCQLEEGNDYTEANKMLTEIMCHPHLIKPLHNKAFSLIKNWETPARNLGMTAKNLKKKYLSKLGRYRDCFIENRIYLDDLFSSLKKYLVIGNAVFYCYPKSVVDSKKQYFPLSFAVYEKVINGTMSVEEMIALNAPTANNQDELDESDGSDGSSDRLESGSMQNDNLGSEDVEALAIDDIEMETVTCDDVIPQIPQPVLRKSAQSVYDRIKATKPVTPPPLIPNSYIVVDKKSFEAFESITEEAKPIMTDFHTWLSKKSPTEQMLIMRNLQQQLIS